ncbi:MAG: YHYH protein [Pseudomonadota bacterium]
MLNLWRLKSSSFIALLIGCSTFFNACAEDSPQRPGRTSGDGNRPPRPSAAMLEACEGRSSGETCSASQGTGQCFAPRDDLPFACVPGGGRRGRLNTRPDAQPARFALGPKTDTSAVLCSESSSAMNADIELRSEVTWWCTDDTRNLIANGIPEHTVGAFPNSGNPHQIGAQYVRYTVPLQPALIEGSTGRSVKLPGYAINGIKFDPGTAGRCTSNTVNPKDCDLGFGRGAWRIEALGQDSFDFGEDQNHAHVQPSGAYHYHGIPEDLLSDAAKAGQEMALIGWAADGFPIYARFGYVDGVLKKMQSSYQLKAEPDAGRPDVELIPMGAFTQDYRYVEGLGDLDECNGRVGKTPEFPDGIYHYYATDTYPFIQRCIKGVAEIAEARRPPARSGERGGRPPRR